MMCFVCALCGKNILEENEAILHVICNHNALVCIDDDNSRDATPYKDYLRNKSIELEVEDIYDK